MSNILFVTGTDTGVGKTVVSTLLLTGLRQRGVDVKVVKPIETGCRLDEAGELVAADAVELWKASGCVQTIDEVSPYRFLTAVAPNVAARKEDREINYSALCQHIEEQSASAELLIVKVRGDC